MKKSFQILALLLFVAYGANAQQEKGIIGSTNWLSNWTEFKPAKLKMITVILIILIY